MSLKGSAASFRLRHIGLSVIFPALNQRGQDVCAPSSKYPRLFLFSRQSVAERRRLLRKREFSSELPYKSQGNMPKSLP